MKIAEAVRKGAKVLDKTDPLWYKEVDINTLDLADGEHCILGQLCGNYYDAGGYIDGLDPNEDPTESSKSVKLGFNTVRKQSFPNLTMAWIKEIFDRRKSVSN